MRLLIFFTFSFLHLAYSTLAEDLPGGKKLKKKPQSLHVIIDEYELRIPRSTFTLGIRAIMENGEVLSTKNVGGRLGLRNFEVSVKGGHYQNGKIRVAADNFNDSLIIRVTTRRFKDVQVTETIPLHREMQLLVKNVPMGAAAPGEKYCLEMEAVFDNGSRRKVGTRALPYSNYHIAVRGGKINRNIIRISDDIEKIANHQVSTTITSRSDSQTITETHYPLDYIKSYRYYASGFMGFSGSNGSAFGIGSIHGEPGRSGDHGPDIHVFISTFYDEILRQDLILAEVHSRGRTQNYLINPNGGDLWITTEGGNGGSGGDGARGRDGQDGRDGRVKTYRKQINDSTYKEIKKVYPGEDGQPGEDGGFGADGGFGGDGGNIYVHFTLSSEQYLNRFVFDTRGGSGGWGGCGGAGGNGGDGGEGEPDGRDAPDGRAGSGGRRGPDGYPGRIFYRVIFENDRQVSQSEFKSW